MLPAGWGKGFVLQHVRPILDRATAEKVAGYTDTVTRKHVGLFEQFGFNLMEESIFERTGIPVRAFLELFP